MKTSQNLLFLLLTVLLLGACRGAPSEKPPIHTQYNMYWQEKFKAQQVNPFFDDRRSDRHPVAGTVARGFLQDNAAWFEGLNPDGSYISAIPAEVTRAFLLRGRDQFNVYCTACHGRVGDGNGPVSNYGYIAASLHTDRAREMPDGEIYSAIANGINTMNSYRHLIKVEDRWAIVAYVRALQRSQSAGEDDLQRLQIDPQPLLTAD